MLHFTIVTMLFYSIYFYFLDSDKCKYATTEYKQITTNNVFVVSKMWKVKVSVHVCLNMEKTILKLL